MRLSERFADASRMTVDEQDLIRARYRKSQAEAKGRRQGFILLGLLLIAGLVIWWMQ